MSVPNWYELLLLAFAAFRTWKLAAEDTIADWPRDRSLELAYRLGGPKVKTYWETLLGCPWCLGTWMALAWWGAWQAWPHGTLVVAVPFAIAAVVPFFYRVTSDE